MRSPFKIEKYQRGEKVLSIVLPKEKGKKPLSLSNLKMILGHMQISAYKTVTTRSSEDYDDFGIGLKMKFGLTAKMEIILQWSTKMVIGG